MQRPNTFFVFSDGACRGNPGPGAWGTVIQNSNEKVMATLSGIEFQTTNNQMELLGAINGLKELSKLLTKNLKNAEIYIYSDSKYLVEGISKWLPSWKKRNWKKADNKAPENLALWQSLDQLNSVFKTVHFNWIKGHAGHPQNEYCDQLANDALNDAGC
ncbi:MAG: ribonuclease HI [Bdellovibrionales bacterium RIFOXYB1_FULL_37_110]|nr:MAG: ribonuclease HI [Bdellovibrionales bacterium RIFOXYA1_FULL_38_20]OFZ51546.1 MAG: ribonuclease HI [Bdellovibrionales bacterium RIFOXYC1_FULL_37_79]OFZ60380.1 MAG: ribonuclease HI [Bdellovibrionales bacterium RIFOXYB1_FULL_37_110]OFZ62097.1 MAG: ribonuclease HI [Bdellovibrionales bacterium RIFOXYB2_FULL_36_6]OFZ63960.1 MAG: ribonuclease HI [Bdellovibrionales bacterium RIFOXYD1_FULL_36_51]